MIHTEYFPNYYKNCEMACVRFFVFNSVYPNNTNVIHHTVYKSVFSRIQVTEDVGQSDHV